MKRLNFSLSFILTAHLVSAQSTTFNNNLFIYGIVGACAVLLIWALFGLASNLMRLEAAKNGINPDKSNIGFLPGLRDFIKPKRPAFADGGSFHYFTKGHDINLVGKPSKKIVKVHASRYAIKPTDFHGMSPIPKIEPEIGMEVKAGDVLMFDKKRPEIKYCAPVSGEVVEIKRGEKRAITEVIILADKEVKYKTTQVPDSNVSRSELVDFMAANGLWPMINERPYDVVPSLDSVPTNIFISTFDTAPLAPCNNFIVAGKEIAFQKGLDVLAKLTSGKVHLGLDGRGGTEPSTAFTKAQNVEKHWFAGPHPAGNVGVHIHHIARIKGNDKVWTLPVQNVITIGQMFLEGQFHADRIIALTGAPLKEPSYVHTYQGANVSDLVKGNVIGDNLRYVSGDVLSGQQVAEDGFIGFNADQVTVLKEGNKYELFGWLLPLAPRPSVSGTIPSYGKNTEFEADTNTHGERRAFVVTGEYESLLPMDLYLQHIMKAIVTHNIEKMEGLGTSELSEEDVALCEFACTSKNPLQSILRDGLNNLKEQL